MLPVKYNAGNVVLRWRSTLATILGISMVVAVYVIVQALAVGLQTSGANTGDPRNLLIVRKGSQSESSSVVNLEQFRSLRYSEWIERDAQNQPMISTDVLTLVNLPRLNGQGEANTTVRGIGGQGRVLRPQVNLVEGRWFSKGKREVVVSQRLAARFENFGIGEYHVWARAAAVSFREGKYGSPNSGGKYGGTDPPAPGHVAPADRRERHAVAIEEGE